MQSFDWHMHSTASDGRLEPPALMERCREAGLSSVAVTDHDTVAGVLPATEAANKLGIQVIPGCEFSTGFQGLQLHLLGYHFNLNDTRIEEICAHVKAERARWMLQTLDKLESCGFFTPAHCQNGATKGLRNVIRAIMAEAKNKTKLDREGIGDVNKFIDDYLEIGCPAYVDRENEFPVAEAISAIHQAGGLAVITHAGLCFKKDLEPLPWLLKGLISLGIDGVESFHGSHSFEMALICHRLVQEHSLFETGGSDFHEPGQDRGELGTWRTYGLDPRFPDWAGV